MKTITKLSILLLAVQVLATTVIAQEPSPREQFNAAVAAIQKSATEDNARKLAELTKQLDPPPAVPADAKFHALKGAAFVKQATDAAAFAKAAGEFQAAIAIAPWIGEYHYNLAVCQKSAGHFPAALTALSLANLFARDDKERDDCLALRAELEAAQELAAAKKTEAMAERQAAAIAAHEQRLEGDWSQDITHTVGTPEGKKHLETLSIKRDAQGERRFRYLYTEDSRISSEVKAYDIQIAGAELRFTYNREHTHRDHIEVTATFRAIATVEPDGRTLKLVIEPLPFTSSQIAYWKIYGKYSFAPKRMIKFYEKQ